MACISVTAVVVCITLVQQNFNQVIFDNVYKLAYPYK